MNVPLIKQPSAFIPLAMSLAALSMVLGHAAIFGIIHESDEGTAAHIFQLFKLKNASFYVHFFILRPL